MVLSEERRDEKIWSPNSINCNFSTYDVKKSSINLTSDMGGNDDFDDSDDSWLEFSTDLQNYFFSCK